METKTQKREGRRPVVDLRPRKDEFKAMHMLKTVILANGCWEWRGYRNATGYAVAWWDGTYPLLHRLSYAAFNGAFDKNLDICHQCDNRACWNPDHLWTGTLLENMLDSIAKGRHAEINRTHCKRGHPLFGENRYSPPNEPTKRVCKICALAKNRIRLGWPEDLAYTIPKGRHGVRPPEVANLI